MNHGKCSICGTDAGIQKEFNDKGHYLTFIDCPICGRYSYVDSVYENGLDRYNKNHMASFLLYNGFHYDISLNELKHYSTEGCDICDKLNQEDYLSGKRYSVRKYLSSESIENWYPTKFAEKIDLILQYINKKAIYVGKSINMNKFETCKLTFQSKDRHISENLLLDLEKINNTRVGYYDRHSGEQTILVSVKKNCDAHSKTIAAFRTLKCAIGALRRIENLSPSDPMYLLCTKFFLFYLFAENPIVIKPTVDQKKGVLCTRGKNSRIAEIQNLLKGIIGNEDERHETNFMIECLQDDTINDTSICVPASIVVYQKEAVGRKLCELDGMIIHPMRKTEQVIFLEAKNTSNKPAYGKNCLKEKFDNLVFEYNTDDIKIINHDAMMKHTI